MEATIKFWRSNWKRRLGSSCTVGREILQKQQQPRPWQNLPATRTPINLLYITAARYLFVTHVLWVQSNRQLIACKEKRDKYSGIIQSFEIPATGVCFPLPYGSATHKSDYDVGLIAVNSGTVTKSFNQYFQAATPNGFGKLSGLYLNPNSNKYLIREENLHTPLKRYSDTIIVSL